MECSWVQSGMLLSLDGFARFLGFLNEAQSGRCSPESSLKLSCYWITTKGMLLSTVQILQEIEEDLKLFRLLLIWHSWWAAAGHEEPTTRSSPTLVEAANRGQWHAVTAAAFHLQENTGASEAATTRSGSQAAKFFESTVGHCKTGTQWSVIFFSQWGSYSWPVYLHVAGSACGKWLQDSKYLPNAHGW